MNEATTIQSQAKARGRIIVFGLALLGVIGLIGLLAYGLAQRSAPPLASGLAPEFSLKTFDGQTISSASLRGNPVVLNFWASWCVPCRDEAPALQRAWETYRTQGLMIVGVDYVDTEPEAKKFIAEFKQTYPNGADVRTVISEAYHISGVPETYFITRDGKLLPGNDAQNRANANYIGPIPESVLIARIEMLLAK